MLELRPSCEQYRRVLPPESTAARICSFECTFCADCAVLLQHCCPNCGGNLVARPIRPERNGRNGNDLQHYPAGAREVYQPADLQAHMHWLASRGITPA